MKRNRKRANNDQRKRAFIIDKLTESIEQKSTSQTFKTEIIAIKRDEISKIHKKDGWFFNWKIEFKKRNRQLYKLTIMGDVKIQGLISLEIRNNDMYVEMHLIENAPHNHGTGKEFNGVAANMIAFACKLIFDAGFNGYVAFTAKTNLVDHYIKTIGARTIYKKDRMGIFTKEAEKLVNLYYKKYLNER